MALFVLAFALLLPSGAAGATRSRWGCWPRASPTSTRSPAWPGWVGVALVWGAWRLSGGGEGRAGRIGRATGERLIARRRWPSLRSLLILPEIGRFADFVDFRALHPGRANEGGLGNLPGQLSPLEALGHLADERVPALGGGAQRARRRLLRRRRCSPLVALALALPRWIARHGAAIPAALLAAAVLYLLARAFGTVYTSAKALAIAAPLIALDDPGRPARRRPRRPLRARAARCSRSPRAALELPDPAPGAGGADRRTRTSWRRSGRWCQDEKVLFLGRDNFVLYELRGSKPFTHVRNFYDPYFVEPNFDARATSARSSTSTR